MHKLSLFSVVMMAVATVTNARNISSSYVFGGTIFFYYALVCVVYFIPAAMVVGDFATKDSHDNGIYHWVTHTLGWRAGTMAVWFQWLENIFYYPLSLLFIITSLSEMCHYSIHPIELCVLSNVLFWSLTLLNVSGIKYSSRSIELLTIFGLLLPLTVLAFASCSASLTMSNVFIPHSLLWPTGEYMHIRNALIITTAAFLGLEINAVHAKDIIRPQYTVPAGLCIAAVVIIFCMVGGSWLMMGWITEDVHAGNAFAHALVGALQYLGMGAWGPFFVLFCLLGPLGGISAWIIGPVLGLQHCIERLPLPQARTVSLNHLLIVQATLVSILSLLYFLHDIQEIFLMMTHAMVAIYFLMYSMMFVAALLDTRPGLFATYVIRAASIVGLLSSSSMVIICLYDPSLDYTTCCTWVIVCIAGAILPYWWLKTLRYTEI